MTKCNLKFRHFLILSGQSTSCISHPFFQFWALAQVYTLTSDLLVLLYIFSYCEISNKNVDDLKELCIMLILQLVHMLSNSSKLCTLWTMLSIVCISEFLNRRLQSFNGELPSFSSHPYRGTMRPTLSVESCYPALPIDTQYASPSIYLLTNSE